MSTKKSGTAGADHSGLSNVVDAAQSLQALQQQAIGRVVQRQLQAMTKLSSVKSPMDLLAIQVDLMTFGMQEAVQFWSQMADVTQSRGGALAGEAGSSAADSAAAASPFGANPMMQAWQSMLNSSLNGAGSAAR
jgi:hypothetical protein